MTVPVPSGLRPEEVARLVEELAPLVVGERLGKVYQLSPTALRLVIGSGSSRRHLLVSTRPGFSRIHLVTDFPEAPAEPSECVLKLRALISGAKITAIRQHRGDRVAKISIEGGGEGPFRREIWIELFGRSGRLLVVEGKTLTVRFLFGRKGITEGERYSPPEKKPSSPLPGEMKMPFDPLALAPQEMRGEEAPLNRFLEVSMARAEIVADANDRLVFLKRELTRILSRRNRLNERLGEELESARDWLSWQRRGELLQGNRHLLERGLERVEVVDWFSEGTPIITVSLDSALTPSENVDRYFRKARKARRSIEHLQKRRAAIEEAVSILEPISARIDAVAVPLDLVKEDVEALLDEAQSLLMIHGVTRREKGGGARARKQRQVVEKYRRFRSREGLQILVGRNALENDQLSIRDARGKDLFFHVAGRPGPHVLLRLTPGKVASPESISDAAFIAAYQSGWRGPQALAVSWTEARFVSKPKGFPPGKVRVERGREILVSHDPERIGTLSVHQGGKKEPGGADS